MIVVFFADDTSASQAALLTACGLTTVDRPVRLLELVRPGSSLLHALPRRSDIDTVRMEAGPFLGVAGQKLLDKAELSDGDLLVAAPLNLMWTPLLARRRHLPVLSCGATFMGTAAMRKALGGVANAVQAAPTHGAPSSGHDVPYWRLQCDSHDVAGPARATARNLANGTIPDRTRLLPVAMPILRRTDAVGLMGGLPAPSILRRAILLASALEAAAADPYADRLDREALAGMLDPAPGLEDRRVSEKLAAFADAFDLLPEAHRSPCAAAEASRRLNTTRRHSTAAAQFIPAQPAHTSRTSRQVAIVRDLHRCAHWVATADATPKMRRS